MNSLNKLNIVLFIAMAGSAQAQHPVQVQRQTANGEYMAALASYKRMPSRIATSAAAIAAGKSAWALGLTEEAKSEFDRALSLAEVNKDLQPTEIARVHFSRGIIEFQEENYQGGLVFADKALDLVSENGPLKSEINQLIGQCLLKLNKPMLAEKKLIEATDGARPESLGDLHYILGSAQMVIGKLDEAKENFELVPLRHEKSYLAIRGLASIALETKNHEEAIFWLNKGREEYADAFLDSWTDYGLIKSYAALGQTENLKESYEQVMKKFPPSDPWLVLIQATAEKYLWNSGNVKDLKAKGS